MTPMFGLSEPIVNGKVRTADDDIVSAVRYCSEMTRLNKNAPGFDPAVDHPEPESTGPAHYVRAWRQYRKMTQDQLADLARTNKSTISSIETGAYDLSSKMRRVLAGALNTTPGRLIDIDPREVDPDSLDRFMRASRENRETIIRVVDMVLAEKTGTSN